MMGHYQVKALLVEQVIQKIMREYHVGETSAMRMFYTSAVGKLLSNDDSGLYGQSCEYIFSLFDEDMKRAVRKQ